MNQRIGYDRKYIYDIDNDTFTKMELQENERRRSRDGTIIRQPQSAERLQNEYNALVYIARETTIPVPEVVSFGEVAGVHSLVMEWVDGVLLSTLKEDKATALDNTVRFINDSMLPQLQQLRSDSPGAMISGQFILPPRIAPFANKSTWPTKLEKEYNFCHLDLAQHNIMVDPESLEVCAIIDWEYSGFYPARFEAPLWMAGTREPGYHSIGTAYFKDFFN